MENRYQFVEFDQYCESCQYDKNVETDPPCDECLEHSVNLGTNKPCCYKPAKKRACKVTDSL